MDSMSPEDRHTTLVLAPGLDGTGMLFAPLLKALPAGQRTQVVRYPADSRWSLGEYARFLADQLPAGRVVLLGESFSSIVVLELLALKLKPIEAAIFSAGFATPPQPSRLWLARVPVLPTLLIAAAPRCMVRRHLLGSSPTREQCDLLASLRGHVKPATIAHRMKLVGQRYAFAQHRLDLPVCYLQASDDRVVPGQRLQWFREHCSSLHVEQFDSPHCLLQCRPKETAAAITRFMSTVG